MRRSYSLTEEHAALVEKLLKALKDRSRNAADGVALFGFRSRAIRPFFFAGRSFFLNNTVCTVFCCTFVALCLLYCEIMLFFI